jgi:hypothetical protein
VVGVLLGGAAGVVTVPLVANAVAQSSVGVAAVLDVTHLPPLLTVENEAPELVFEAQCAPAGVEDAEAGCDISGTLFAREAGRTAFVASALEPHGSSGHTLTGSIPRALAGAPALEYFATFEADGGARVTVPPGGETAPYVSRRLANPTLIALGRHAFGGARRAGERVVSARWGPDNDEVGLEAGRNLDPIGASSFDVDAAGTVAILDHAKRRLLRWERGVNAPTRIPLAINGSIADLATAGDGSLYVLETTSRDGRAPLVRRFDDAGRELEAIEVAERGPAQIRVGKDGPAVLQRPSHQWMPVFVAGVPASPTAQHLGGSAGRTLPSGTEVVVYRHANELRIALVAGAEVTRSWRLTSETALGEVQLAEPVGGARFVVVARVYDDRTAEFAVLILDRRGLASRTGLEPAEWAEGAPLSRFRLRGRALYRLGSTPAGVFVDRFDLEVR